MPWLPPSTTTLGESLKQRAECGSSPGDGCQVQGCPAQGAHLRPHLLQSLQASICIPLSPPGLGSGTASLQSHPGVGAGIALTPQPQPGSLFQKLLYPSHPQQTLP